MHKQGNIAHEVYAPQSTTSNGTSALSGPPGPPFFMGYSYEPGTNHVASSSEPIEFGSLGPLPAADGDDIPRSTHQMVPNGFYGQRRGPYRGGSSHSSPDQPSSPQPRRLYLLLYSLFITVSIFNVLSMSSLKIPNHKCTWIFILSKKNMSCFGIYKQSKCTIAVATSKL